MKKLIAIFLIVLLVVPVASFADDPIVGTWYVYSGLLNNNDVCLELSLFSFTEDNFIFSSTYDVSKSYITTAKDYKAIGVWTNENGRYYVNIGLKGAQEVFIENDSMFFPVSDFSIRIHKLTTVNYVLDYKQ